MGPRRCWSDRGPGYCLRLSLSSRGFESTRAHQVGIEPTLAQVGEMTVHLSCTRRPAHDMPAISSSAGAHVLESRVNARNCFNDRFSGCKSHTRSRQSTAAPFALERFPASFSVLLIRLSNALPEIFILVPEML